MVGSSVSRESSFYLTLSVTVFLQMFELSDSIQFVPATDYEKIFSQILCTIKYKT